MALHATPDSGGACTEVVAEALLKAFNELDGDCLLRRCKCEVLRQHIARLPCGPLRRELLELTSRPLTFAELAALRTRLPAMLDRGCPLGNLDIDQRVGIRGWVQSLTRVPAAPAAATASAESTAAAPPVTHFLAGAIAGAVSRTVTAPLETLRVRMQVSGRCALPPPAAAPPASALARAGAMMVQEARAVLREGGLRALYRGNAVNVLRATPAKAIDFAAFEVFKRLLGAPAGSWGVLAAGALAGATSAAILHPLDVARSRLALDRGGVHRSVGAVLAGIVRTEGGLPALYRGAGASLVAILPEAAIAYGLYDVLKSSYRSSTGTEPGVGPSLAAGVLSAFTGQLVAYPLETVARRMQVRAAGAGGGALPMVRQLLATEGMGALYAGIVPASLRVIPMAMVSFSVYEAARRALSAAGQATTGGGPGWSAARVSGAGRAAPLAALSVSWRPGAYGGRGGVGGAAGAGGAGRPRGYDLAACVN